MTTPWTERISSPATTTEVTCELYARKIYKNNGSLYVQQKAAPDDIRGHLDAQTAEYRQEVLAAYLGRQLYVGSDDLRAQLAAAVAERDAARCESGTFEERAIDAELDLTSARETLRELGELNSNQAKEIRRQRELMTEDAETIRKLKKETTAIDAALHDAKETIRAMTEEAATTWKRAINAQRRRDSQRSNHEGYDYVPYEPPRSPGSTPMARGYWTCPDCGPHVKADEDGCCATCGMDCIAHEEPPRPDEVCARCAGTRTVWGNGQPDGKRCPNCSHDLPRSDEGKPCADPDCPDSRGYGSVHKRPVPVPAVPTQPAVHPETIAKIERIAKMFDCDPDTYSIMCAAEAMCDRAAATPIAPLADRERAIVAAAMAWYRHINEHCGGFPGEIALRNKLAEACSDDDDDAAVDIPKTPDVFILAPGPHGDLPPELEHPANKMVREAMRREEARDARSEETIGSGTDRWTTSDPRVIALHREFRLATEHVEAMRPVVDAVVGARADRVRLPGSMYSAVLAYESWLNARGGK